MSSDTIIVNYGMGNLFSIQKKLDKLNEKSVITSDHKDILNANKIILPGVGHFSKAIRNLKEQRIWDSLNEAVLVKRKPVLGICLGLQLMAKKSEEGESGGFGWFDADVVRFRVSDPLRYKIPHMGWNQLTIKKQHTLFENVSIDSEFYFVHSYHIISNNHDEVLTTTNYEYEFVSGLQKDNIYGIQFHPEKSHYAGEKIFSNFLKL